MNWKRIISELVDDGWSNVALAKECGTRPEIISQLKTGRTKEPKYRLGVALVSLWQQRDRERAAA